MLQPRVPGCNTTINGESMDQYHAKGPLCTHIWPCRQGLCHDTGGLEDTVYGSV